jgi:hypothetical protein
MHENFIPDCYQILEIYSMEIGLTRQTTNNKRQTTNFYWD